MPSDPVTTHPFRAMVESGKKQAILQATLSVMSEKSFHEATIDEIAERAGVGKGTIYSYFPSKTALVEELIETVSSLHFEKATKGVEVAKNARAQLLTLVEYELDFVKRHSEIAFYLAQHEPTGLSPEFRQRMFHGHERYLNFIADIILRGQKEGQFDSLVDAHVAASMIMGLRIHVLRDQIVRQPNVSLESIREQIVHFIMHGLTPIR